MPFLTCLKRASLAGNIAAIFLILCGVYITPHFVQTHLSPDGIIEQTETVMLINGYRIAAAAVGVLILFLSIFKPTFFSSATNALVARSFNLDEEANSKPRHVSTNAILLLLSVIMLGLSLRVYGIDYQSLWNDELTSWSFSSLDTLEEVVNCLRVDVHPPGYQILLYFVEKYVGTSESALRLPSVVFGVLSILLVFLLGLRLYSYKEGLIASLFTAVLWCPIYYSQEARPYSALLLFTSLASYFWISLIRTMESGLKCPYRVQIGYVLAAGASCYLHYFGLYLTLLQGIGAFLFLYRRPKAVATIIIIYLTVLVLYVPWIPSMWEHLHRGPTHIPKPSLFALTNYLEFLFNRSHVFLTIILFLFFLLFYINLLKFTKFRKQRSSTNQLLSPDLMLFLWLIIPFAGAFVKSVVSSSIYTDRNLIISLPAAYLLLARSITQFNMRSGKLLVVTSLVACLFLFHLIYFKSYYSKPHKEQFREAVNFILQNDSIYQDSTIVGYAWHEDYFNYYFERKGSNRRVKLLAGKENDISKFSAALAAENPLYIWYFSGHRIPDPAFMNFLNKELTLVKLKEFVGTKVWLFKNKTKRREDPYT